jgi:phosphate transport system substrate-binding protein
MRTNIIIFSLAFIIIMGCGDKDQNIKPSLPTRGKLVIGIDESLRPFTDAEITMFSFYYPESRITPLYLPERQVIEKLLVNEIQTGIICRDLSTEESDFIKSKHSHSATTFKLAYDKIVAVVNNTNPINTISYDDMKKIISGTITEWGQFEQSLKTKSPIMVVIPGSSSIDRYFSSSDDPFSPVSTYALDTTTEVIDYVKNNVSAIGIVGGSWFYQKGKGYSDVKLLAYSEGNRKIEKRTQTLLREVYAVTHEPFTGLGNGFISFIASRKGQLIISKAGLTPYNPIERQIKIMKSL